MAAFIGRNSAYYLTRWGQLDGTLRKISFSLKAINWSAFFLNIFWVAYRKMYAIAIIYALVMCAVMGVIEAFFTLPASVNNGTSIALMLVCGVYGNHLYKRHVEKQIATIKANLKTELQDAAIRKKGGVSYIAPIPFIILHLLTLFGMIGQHLDGRKATLTPIKNEGWEPIPAQQSYLSKLPDAQPKANGFTAPDNEVVWEEVPPANEGPARTKLIQALEQIYGLKNIRANVVNNQHFWDWLNKQPANIRTTMDIGSPNTTYEVLVEYANSLARLGQLFENKDMMEAKNCYRMGADLGNGFCKQRLTRIQLSQ